MGVLLLLRGDDSLIGRHHLLCELLGSRVGRCAGCCDAAYCACRGLGRRWRVAHRRVKGVLSLGYVGLLRGKNLLSCGIRGCARRSYRNRLLRRDNGTLGIIEVEV